ncbi:aminotransferase class IV [Candidatus Protofrankia datiscae]|uniref:Aminotransferase class IV n=1 Tax=Candidatus Protofrankia datiscae TaxID=2716812 RepID=F8B265_9ACTN|nr:aminotransferase class IV [Candidatus Protofrankia datiscae]AEH09859.1 aminotransferase class IV [Candidatus Protofrankia datiscae]
MELDGAPPNVNDLVVLALTNYGHFTTMRVECQRVRGLSLHLKRLAHDCRLLFDAELDVERVRHLARRATRPIGAGSCVLRITVFDPALEVGHPSVRAQPRVLVNTRPAPAAPLPPLRVRSVAYRRNMPAVKHVGLFDALRHRRAAQLNGFDDVLFTEAAPGIASPASKGLAPESVLSEGLASEGLTSGGVVSESRAAPKGLASRSRAAQSRVSESSALKGSGPRSSGPGSIASGGGNPTDLVSEGATWNVGCFDGDHVIWPAADCLRGVTMQLLQRTHEGTIIAPVDWLGLVGMQAAFATNAAVGVRAIAAVDDRELAADHPIVETLRREYLSIPGEPL